MPSVNFDHSYTEDMGHKFFKALGRAGFRLSENQVAHPGKNFCRFITFDRGDGRAAYLEFVDVGRGGKRVNKAGISLRYSGPLKKYFDRVKKGRGVKVKYVHRNYAWKKDSKSRLPGWNFLTFVKPVFKNLFPWFTEYEPRPSVKRLAPPKHPNTAGRLFGVVLAARAQDRPKLETVFGRSLAGRRVNLGGIQLIIETSKTTRLSALVIECRDFKRFTRSAKVKSPVLWEGRKAALIRNPDRRMWDIIVVEK
ncbi:MAG TPA: hypothetical protein PK523_05225 [Elusimicrobiales bacterium]|nr:hypothetical protein [Elusimicrobiales bacterium]